MERLHPQSLRMLRELTKLHGAAALIRAIREIDQTKPEDQGKLPLPHEEG